MSSSTKVPWEKISLPIINIYKEKIIVMEEIRWKNLVVDVDTSFLLNVHTEKSYLQGAIPCFLIIFVTIVLFLPSQLLVDSFPSSSIQCWLEYMPLPCWNKTILHKVLVSLPLRKTSSAREEPINLNAHFQDLLV